ncbi:MAG: DNA repair protein RecO [Rhodobacteraceae bacterium]|nr:DNA repair protein RecO [Paracoccaceae bacterium]
MEWTDEGILLSVRKHGEGSAIVEILTENHGRHAGVVRGGGSKKAAATLQPGSQFAVNWRARLEDHLGTFSVELKKSRVTSIMSGRLEIAAFGSISALLLCCLPERDSQNGMYHLTLNLFDTFRITENWLKMYVHWEMDLLQQTGFGLDLTDCAVTGVTKGLCYVSPKSGRAVSREGAKGWEDRLLPLPRFLLGSSSDVSPSDIQQGLKLTGYFLNNRIMTALGKPELPHSRHRFMRQISLKFNDKPKSTVESDGQ